ncbi:sensor histidine kinase KdpD [Sphingomonas sp. SORGH_AS_0879]|uniref:sensor histidine kinase n=1 Tax=Sphingomonas sp. SORGH_AS_0879 TaxID=3041790 RepID=UPI002787AB69|nr:sensor histidine kinase [Sphingomonas sp. SORGH_AS_0879]MDQ1231837.1 signal transduction histidine kinase [Sphingomonas sp. SORGH_AS_0879]
MTQLLALARAEEAGVAPPRERVDLREVAVAVINRRIAQAIEAGIDVHLDAPIDIDIAIASHRTLLFEILSNLLDNAIRYNRRGGQVMLNISCEDGAGARITVADNGSGLPDAELARLGERFTRLSTARDSEGSGLGLAIVRSAASRLDASLEIVNTRPGLCITLDFGSDNLGTADARSPNGPSVPMA